MKSFGRREQFEKHYQRQEEGGIECLEMLAL
jgi:hypothetical protein